jgi:hypothetical protein
MKNDTKNLGGKGRRTYNKNKEGQLDWSHLAQEPPSETDY